MPLVEAANLTGEFTLLDLVPHFRGVSVKGVAGPVPTVLLPADEDLLNRLRRGEAARAGCSAFTRTHARSGGGAGGTYTCEHAPERCRDAQRAATAAAAAECEEETKPVRGNGTLHPEGTVKGVRCERATRAEQRADCPQRRCAQVSAACGTR